MSPAGTHIDFTKEGWVVFGNWVPVLLVTRQIAVGSG